MKLVEVQATKELANAMLPDIFLKMAVDRVLDAAPGFDLVRCKDCKYRLEPTKMCAHPRAIGWDALEPEDDDFCSCGERITE